MSSNDLLYYQEYIVLCTLGRHYSSAKHKIRSEKRSDEYQLKIKFVLTFSNNDQSLVETYTVALYFCLEICQIKLGVNSKCDQKVSDV